MFLAMFYLNITRVSVENHKKSICSSVRCNVHTVAERSLNIYILVQERLHVHVVS